MPEAKRYLTSISVNLSAVRAGTNFDVILFYFVMMVRSPLCPLGGLQIRSNVARFLLQILMNPRF